MAWENNPPPQNTFNIPAEEAVVKSGIYNKSISVGPSETFWATGSNNGAAALLAKTQDFTASLSAGGDIEGSFLDAGVVHDLGIRKIETGATGEVKLLYSAR